MADIEYSIKSSLPIRVTIGASEASATICWRGAVKDNTNCLKCDEEKIYCENVYIGTNDCVDGESSERSIEGSLTWNDLSIPYVITQEAAICSTCGDVVKSCDILNHWVSPYVVTPEMSATTLYWEYWLTQEDDCDIIREKILSSTTINISTDIPCDKEDRIVPFSATVSCNKTIDGEYYIQKPDVCCPNKGGTCYEINEIVYNPTSVPYSGGVVDFSFDYKKIEVGEDCETKETYGTYFGKWKVPECKGDECCSTKDVESSFTWNEICGRGDLLGCNIVTNSKYDDGDLIYIPSSSINISFSSATLNDKNTVYLSILRDKSFSAECEVHCDFDTVYCVDRKSVRTEYYDYESGQWSAFTSNDYAYPYYGGRLRVAWEYYIITIYEDCTVGISKGNKYVDTLTIYENDNCEDHKDYCNITLSMKQEKGKDGIVCSESGDTIYVTVNGEIDKGCGLEFLGGDCTSYDGGKIVIKPNQSSKSKSTNNSKECKAIAASPNCVGYDGGEIIVGQATKFEIPYVFKKGLCDLPQSQMNAVIKNLPKNVLPDNICPNKGEEKEKCNEFTVTYYQFEKDCNPDCVPCFYNYMIDDVPSAETTVTRETRSDCNLKIFAYGDGEMNGSKFRNDCSNWVNATVNKGYVTFKISANTVKNDKGETITGPYRRGKVIFIHDDKCKEEVIINQIGMNESGNYTPDPGYDCDLHLEFENNSCVSYDGGTIIIRAEGGGDVEKYCVGYEGGTIIIPPPSCASGETVVTFNINNEVLIDGCLGKYEIGTYTYTGQKPSQNLFNYQIHPTDTNWIKEFTFEDISGQKKGNIYVIIKESNPSDDSQRTSKICEVYYNNVSPFKEFNIIQEQNEGACSDDDELFKNLITSFNTVLTANNRKAISENNTKDVYDYLLYAYDRAKQEFNDDNSVLFKKETYTDMEIIDYRILGTSNNKERGFSAMTSWLMAMQLSEIVPTEDTGEGNIQTALFKKAYEIGGGHKAPLYNYTDIHSDVSVVRLIASAIYAITRAEYNFEDIDTFRGKLCINIQDNTPINDESKSWDKWYSTFDGDVCTGYTYTAWYGSRLDEIFNTPPGPFAKNYYEVRGGGIEYWCSGGDKSEGRDIPSGQDETLFDSRTKNYHVDKSINTEVVSKYNLHASDNTIERTVQAIADESEAIQHLFGNKTYYKYNRDNPFGSFTPALPNDYDGYFNGVFNSEVTSKDLSSLLANETGLADFLGVLFKLPSESRDALLNPNYGRIRPGQDTIDMSCKCGGVCHCPDGGECKASECNCVCEEGCITQNYLTDFSIVKIVGSGTKYYGTEPFTYYVDMDGNGYYDQGNDIPIDGAINETNGDEVSERCSKMNSTTYPSGHSAGIWGLALFLMEILPDRWIEIYKAAYKYTVSRSILRQHWNSDIIYGKLVATTTVPIIHAYNNFNNLHFRYKFDEAKNKIKNY